MNTTHETPHTRPSYWFGIIEHGLRDQLRNGLTDLDLSRGEWRILHMLADGPQSAQVIEDSLPESKHFRRMRDAMREHHRFAHEDGHGHPGFEHGHGHEGHAGFEHGRPDFAQSGAGFAHHGHAGFEHHGRGFAGEGRPGFGRGFGGRGHRGPRDVKSVLYGFAEKGWVTIADGVATLTETGRAEHDAAFARVTELRSSVTEGISEADYATTMATLEKMARNLGWTEPNCDDAE